jgi:hypothetical protein
MAANGICIQACTIHGWSSVSMDMSVPVSMDLLTDIDGYVATFTLMHVILEKKKLWVPM